MCKSCPLEHYMQKTKTSSCRQRCPVHQNEVFHYIWVPSEITCANHVHWKPFHFPLFFLSPSPAPSTSHLATLDLIYDHRLHLPDRSSGIYCLYEFHWTSHVFKMSTGTLHAEAKPQQPEYFFPFS
jgi:hypothetical protein